MDKKQEAAQRGLEQTLDEIRLGVVMRAYLGRLASHGDQVLRSVARYEPTSDDSDERWQAITAARWMVDRLANGQPAIPTDDELLAGVAL